MKTGMGIIIKPEHLTAVFCFEGIVCPIGKFDPSSYPELIQEIDFKTLAGGFYGSHSQAVFDQLDDSTLFTKDQLTKICDLPQKEYCSYIIENVPIFTRSGIIINPDDLTATFHFCNKSCLIGKFDPEIYPNDKQYKSLDWDNEFLHQPIIQQLEDSKMFSEDELMSLYSISSEMLIQCIDQK